MSATTGTEARATTRFAPRSLDTRALSAWVLSLAVILYLAFNGGGYSVQSHAQVAIAVWWIVVVCAAWGLLPVARPTGAALGTVGLFAAFVIWSALAITWSISAGRSFQDLTLVTCYLGILVLALSIHRDRADGVRHTIAAVATAITLVAMIALASRIWPDLFTAARAAERVNPATRERLSWPLNYWNALACLMAVGLPLLLTLATSARTLLAQAAAGAAIPLLALCAALTLSRGGVAASIVALVVFIALVPDRATKLAALLLPAAGAAALIAGAFDRHALEHGLANAAERHQGWTLALAILIVCGGVLVGQLGIGLATRHASMPAALAPSRPRARLYLAAALLVLVAVALAVHVPHRIDHAWNDFKNPNSAVAQNLGRFGSAGGEGRYQFWVAAVDSAKAHPFTGSGPGTFQLDWLPRAKIDSYVENAHSLYIETYAELGIVGLALLVGFFMAALVALVRRALRSRYEERTRAAGITAALLAFMLYAAFDWVWQVPVIAAAVLLLIGASFAPGAGPALGEDPGRRRAPHWALPAALTLVGVACLAGTAYPLAVTDAVANSEQAVNVGNVPVALKDARDAVNLEAGSAAAQIQLALVLEAEKRYGPAVAAAQRATRDEPQGWTNWLVLSRLYAEDGNARGSLAAYRQARAMNPQSTLFSS